MFPEWRPVPDRQQIVAEARLWIGTPFGHQARVKDRGLDCVGLPIMVAHRLKIPARTGELVDPQKYANYCREPVDGEVLRICRELLCEKSGPAIPGDVLCLRVPRVPCHLGIVAWLPGYPSIIHARPYVGRRGGRVVEHRLDDYWSRQIVAIFSFPGVDS